MSDVHADLQATPARRLFGLCALFGLGALMLYLALTQPFESMIWRVFLLGMAGGAFWIGLRMQQATAMELTLTDEGLFDSSGFQLAALKDVKTVERGMLAFKPSNGFMIKTYERQPRRWRPGLYWISGRSIGIGGVTGGGQGKAMADIMNMKLQELHRDQED
jgi:hypothetical protein